MPNIQKENGHLDIANELVEYLARYPLSPAESQILWCVWRKTWSWKKKEENIPLSQFEKMTELSRQGVCKAKKKLVNKRLLVISKNGVSFNKNYQDWLVNDRVVNNRVVNKTAIASQRSYTKSKEKEESNKEEKEKLKETFSKELVTTVTVREEKIHEKTELQLLVEFLETTLNTKITNWGKQAQAWKMMHKAGYTADQIMKVIVHMAQKDDFFVGKGFDLMTVCNQMPRYKAQSEAAHHLAN